MSLFYFAKEIMDYTIQHSGFEERRDYLSLSLASFEIDYILKTYQEGFTASPEEKLKCYKGLQMEKDLLSRMKAVYKDRIETGFEISAAGGKIKGHPDFLFDGNPGDVKSLPFDRYMPLNLRVSKKNFYQMQAYLYYMDKKEGVIIYESRESGSLLSIPIRANVYLQQLIKNKYDQLLNLIEA